jgi:hypothetical protein
LHGKIGLGSRVLVQDYVVFIQSYNLYRKIYLPFFKALFFVYKGLCGCIYIADKELLGKCSCTLKA